MKARNTKIAFVALGAAALVGTLTEPADAGVVVLKNGEVLVGRIRPDEDTPDELTMRWPYKDRTERGEIKLPKYRVRWYDRDADEPTDEYWEKYENEVIDSQWLPALERWRIRKRNDAETTEVPIIEPFDTPKGKLSPVAMQTRDFEIKKPDGWTSTTEDGIMVFVSDQPGADGFRPRIHVFAGPRLSGSVEPQIELVRREIARLAGATGTFETREMKRLKPVRGGFDQEMLTVTKRGERAVFGLRQISFRDKHTYMFSAYADERDYAGLEILFKACMRTLVFFEDQKPAPGATPPGGAAPPGGAPAPGGATSPGGTPPPSTGG